MKLTNQQINAIVSEARDNFNKKQAELKKNLFKDKSLIKKSKDLYKAYKELPQEIKDLMYNKPSSDHYFLSNLVNKKFKSDIFDGHALSNKIVILSIDSKDLDDLKKKLNINF
jgi:hypothetical protein